MRAGWVALAILALIPLFATIQSTMGADTPGSGQFNRSIRPLLADRCFRCHGPDAGQRKADLRLDERESVVRERDGVFTIRPGVPDESELLARLTSTDPALRMPPPGSGEPLSVEQISQLRDWIADGAVYDRFWSLIPPRRHPAPALRDVAWSSQPLDRWILNRLEAEGLAPSQPATRETLIRRVTLDLTGLAPTERELDDFLADDAPDAYDRVVDRLLASPRFGERQAQFWLDAARYADTNGYFTDNERTMWRWRDGVIDSFNQNQPFDQFTIEQLAGDLLPDATEAQRIASGFNRNHMSNNETGLIDEEFRISYVMDRLETTGTVWLGLTLNCARCHSHKFDPVTQREYYQLLAYFNQVDEVGTVQGEGNSPPLISAPTADQVERLNRLKRIRDEAQAAWRALEPQVQTDLAEWSRDATTTLPVPTTSGLLARFSFETDLPSLSTIKDASEQDAQPTLAAASPDEKIGYASGVQGRAAQFDASAHCVATRVESFDFERTDSFTIGAWIHPTTGNAGCVLSKIDDDQFLRGFDLFYEKGKLVAHLNHRAESDAIRVKSTRPIVSDWQHVVVTYDGSSRAAGVRIYINGELDPGVIEFDNLQGSIRNAQPFRIG
ncbi:MAG: DUF1549 domain-containing protein, partial [Planctomycetota bacterium]|nr:DUF1549 domain-containing protein [Planctomycetota bacterium]